MSTEEHLTKYRQAVARQQWDNSPNVITLVERMPDDTFRYTCKDGRTGRKSANIDGKHLHLCGR